MKSSWLNGPSSSSNILFFHGWGMEPQTLKELDCGDLGVLVCYDYSTLELSSEVTSLLTQLPQTKVVAWSFGVVAAAHLLGQFNITDGLAINGTLTPIDNQKGIPPEIFEGTVSNWLNPKARANFYRRIGSKTLPSRAAEEQLIELKKLQLVASQKPINIYSKAIISERDRIFAPQNQEQAWQESGTKIEQISGANHDYLAQLSCWQEVYCE